jgi:nucleotide-binding universal stress UspA family protein/heme-degrading monooxygenase HmoA
MSREVAIAVAVEDTSTAGVVAAGAAHIVMEQGATQVILTHALDTHTLANALYGGGGLHVPTPGTLVEESGAEAEEVLGLAEAALRAEYEGLECPLPTICHSVCEGRSYAAAISQVAANAGAKAIVVGARRPHAFGRLTHPDVRASLARYTDLPIYVVPLHAPPNKSSAATSDGVEQQTMPVKHATVILVTLDLLPEEASQLQADWPRIADAAVSMPACRYIRLLHDRHDDMRWVVATEWDDADLFDDFVRKSGLQWRGRARSLNDQTRYAYFDVTGSVPPPRSNGQTGTTTSDQVRTEIS